MEYLDYAREYVGKINCMDYVREYVDVDVVQKEAMRLYNTYSKDTEAIEKGMFVIHAILVAIITSRRYASSGKRRAPLFSGFVVMLVSGLGGALLSSLLTGEAAFFFANDFYIGTMLAAWLMINLPPFSLVYYIATFPPVMSILLASEGIFLGGVVCNAVEATFQRYPGTILIPIFFGTLSGSGGLISGQGLFRGLEKEKGATELASASLGVVGPFLAAVVYTITVFTGKHKLEIPPIGHPVVDSLDLEVHHLLKLWFVFYFQLGLVLDTLNYLFGGSKAEGANEAHPAKKHVKPAAEKTPKMNQESSASPGPKKKGKKHTKKKN